MNACKSGSHIECVEVPQTGATLSRSVYDYNCAGELIRARHYGRWRAALLLFRLLASRVRRAVLISLRRDV
jgi:hypothetical protein